MNPLLIRRRGMMMAQQGGALVFHSKLVFDGVAYIATDIIPPADFSVRFGCGDETLHAAQRLFGCPGTNSTGFRSSLNSNTTNTTRFFSVFYGSSSSLSSNRNLPFSSNLTYFQTPLRFGWGNTAFTYTKGNGTPNGGLYFGMTDQLSGSPYTGFMNRVRIYDSTARNASNASDLINYTPIYNLRPCTYNGEAGLWNVEESKFYGNSAGAGMLTVDD